MADQDALYATACRVRAELERGKTPRKLLAGLYSVYNPLADLDGFLDAAAERFPHGSCGIASLLLRERLGTGSVVRGSYAGHPHTFLALEEGMIADLTADQFGGPPVYAGPLRLPWKAGRASGRA